MITGCNTNVLYRGKQFHVQTEDSGRANPHIISHVYHGGTIIASEKSEYGDRVDSEEIDIKVRAKIELQHKAMLKRLTSGELDELIEERIGGLTPVEKPPPPRAATSDVAEPPPRAAGRSAARAADASVAKRAALAAEDSVAKRAARIAEASAAGRAAIASDAASSTAIASDAASSTANAADTAGATASGADAASSTANAADTAGATASGADSTGSITAGAATDPSVDAQRPVADTEPLLDGKTTPGFGTRSDSEKPLDEVILEYLVDKARGRSAGNKQPPARRQRKKG